MTRVDICISMIGVAVMLIGYAVSALREDFEKLKARVDALKQERKKP